MDLLDELSSRPEFLKLQESHPKTFKKIHSKKLFQVNDDVDFEFCGATKANQILFEKYGGMRKTESHNPEESPVPAPAPQPDAQPVPKKPKPAKKKAAAEG